MKLALIYYNFQYGGLGRLFAEMANALSDRGIDIDLVVFRAHGIFKENISSSVNIVDLGFSYTPSWFSPVVWIPSSPLVKYLKTGGCDVVHSLGEGISDLCAWIKFWYKLRFRLIISRHNVMIRADDNWLKRLVKPVFTPFAFSQAEYCVCVSQGLANDLVKGKIRPMSKIKVIYNPIIPRDLDSKMNAPVEHLWVRSCRKPVIVSLGRLAYAKGYDSLIKAFAYLRKNLSIDVFLIMLGEGPERTSLEKLIGELSLEKEVDLAGFVENPYAYLSKANLFVLSSRYEGLGNVLVEALACGVNVVATDCHWGPSEILENGKWGRLVPVDDIQRMAEAMKDALLHPMLSEELKKRGDFFSVDRAFDMYYDLFTNKKTSNDK
ncbi:MAG: glycosyltransferase [Synergistaceae bacterium]|jgi:glycosyltransferase involved in cell wall biosynthesis|nr:glycosyltransferase [Synergistaceae bacterium]